MTFSNIPVIIPLLATGYLLTIYLLLVLAQRHTKNFEEDDPVSAAPKTLHKQGTRG